MDISITRGDWWGQPPYGSVTLENNVFGHSTNGGTGWHYYGLAWFIGKFANARVVNNTFENAVGMASHIGPARTRGVWANNIGGGWDCLSGVTYRGNVGKKCDASDIAMSARQLVRAAGLLPARRCRSAGSIPPAYDFHLKSARRRQQGQRDVRPAKDRDGKARNGAPDVGHTSTDPRFDVMKKRPWTFVQGRCLHVPLLCRITLHFSVYFAPPRQERPRGRLYYWRNRVAPCMVSAVV